VFFDAGRAHACAPSGAGSRGLQRAAAALALLFCCGSWPAQSSAQTPSPPPANSAPSAAKNPNPRATTGITTGTTNTTATQQFPNVVNVQVKQRGPDRFDFDVTLSSPYDTAERYADGFRAVSASGLVYGERRLAHDHADEQPFTRDLPNIKIPVGISSVIIQGRDKRFGYGGKSMTVALPGR
jgi:hypothetical protein